MAKSATFVSTTAKFVASVTGGQTIDATGMAIFPGGVDVHTHVAGGSINFARAMTPEDHRRTQAFIRSQTRRSGIGGMAPTTFATGYLYAGMGWTTVNEAAVPVLSARHTHEELSDIPIVDKSCLVLMANNEIVLDLMEQGEYERAKQIVAWYVWAAKSYGVKAVNPGGVAAWKYGKDAKQLTEPISGYQTLTPGNIVTNLAKMVEELGIAAPAAFALQRLGQAGQHQDDLGDHQTFGRPSRPLGSSAIPRLWRRRLDNDEVGSGAVGRILQRPPEHDDRCRRGAVR